LNTSPIHWKRKNIRKPIY